MATKPKNDNLVSVAEELAAKLRNGEYVSFEQEAKTFGIPIKNLRSATANRLLNLANSKIPEPELLGEKVGDEKTDYEQLKIDHQRKFDYLSAKNTAAKEKTVVFENGPVLIVFFGDQHIGNKGTDIKRMFKELIIAVQTPNTYVFMMGDVVDNFIVSKLLAKNFSAAVGIEEQWKLAQHYMSIAGNKLLGAVA